MDSELRAATLYNKGRIDEARGRREQALDAYKQSLTIRANTTVRQRLRALDAKAAADFDPLRLSALRGPMANLKELAKEISSEARVEVGEQLFLTPSAAFREGRVLTKQHEFLPQSSLALRTAKGWFLLNNFYLEETEGGSHTSALQTSCMYEAAELAGKVSLLSCTEMTSNYNRGEKFSDCEYRPGEKTVLQLTLWCAVRRSGFPSCTEPLPIAELRENYDCQQNAHLEEDWALLPTVNSGGVTLTLSPTRRYGYRDSSHGLLGRHPLRFSE